MRHVPVATFVRPDLGVFCRLDELGLEVVGLRLEPDRGGAGVSGRAGRVRPVVLQLRAEGVPRDTVSRRLAHEPFGWRPTTLLLTITRPSAAFLPAH